jgi:hypothetical protein
MANRAMNPKLQRARMQARYAAALEFTKPAYILQTSKRELRAIAATFDERGHARPGLENAGPQLSGDCGFVARVRRMT